MKAFSIEESLKFGWEKTKAHSGLLFQVMLTLFAFQVVYAMVSKTLDGTALGVLASLALAVVGIFIGTGFTIITLKIAKGEAATFRDIVPPAPLVWKFFLASLLTGLLICLGFFLLIIPGVYLALRWIFVKYLVLNGKGVMESLKVSADMTDGIKWELFGLVVVVIVINLLGVIAFMVGLLLTVPVTAIALAHVYQKLLNRAPAPEVPANS